MLVREPSPSSDASAAPRRVGFLEDFKRFFVRGLAALLPTLITLWLLIKVWSFLWENLGVHCIWAIKWFWLKLGEWGVVAFRPAGYIDRWFDEVDPWKLQVVGVAVAFVVVYIVGLFVGNIIGRTGWRLLEMGLMRIPIVRAIFPAVKQVTEFLLSERGEQFRSSRVVAVQPHANGIWSIGLVTGGGLKQLGDAVQRDMVTVFVPSSPTAFAGYVMVVPRDEVVDLPMSVEDALRLLATGGVVSGSHGDLVLPYPWAHAEAGRSLARPADRPPDQVG